jgi:hypothetical protein
MSGGENMIPMLGEMDEDSWSDGRGCSEIDKDCRMCNTQVACAITLLYTKRVLAAAPDVGPTSS